MLSLRPFSRASTGRGKACPCNSRLNWWLRRVPWPFLKFGENAPRGGAGCGLCLNVYSGIVGLVFLSHRYQNILLEVLQQSPGHFHYTILQSSAPVYRPYPCLGECWCHAAKCPKGIHCCNDDLSQNLNNNDELNVSVWTSQKPLGTVEQIFEGLGKPHFNCDQGELVMGTGF